MMANRSPKQSAIRAYAQRQEKSSESGGDFRVEFLLKQDRELLVREFQPKIVAIARRLAGTYSDASIDVDDLISCGAIGLLEAMDRYDSNMNNRFSTYAEFRIRGAMLDALRSLDHTSRYRRDQGKEIRHFVDDYHDKYGSKPSQTEIAEYLGVSLEKLSVILQENQPVHLSSLDEDYSVGMSDGGRSLAEMIADEDAVDPLDVLLDEEIRTGVHEAIEALPERERHCVVLYYGRNFNLSELAEVFGLTKARISQILAEARKKMKAHLTRSL
ncbi:MAG: hypothetical protein CMK59_10085 [Proteobacteria bacterium]|nr:hypothetical protein [Pseudomonadota bacterium]